MTPVLRACAAGLISVFALTLPAGAWGADVTEPTAPGALPSLPPGLAGKPQGEWAKADGAIRGLVAEFAAHRARGAPGQFRPSNSTLQFSRGRITVDIVAEGDPEALIAELEKLGMRNASHYGRVISGQIPVGQLARTVELQGLQAISAARKPLTNTGSVDGLGDDAMFADLVHSDPTSPLTGDGIVIGMMSNSFDQQGGYASGQSSGDLPAGINVLDDSANCGDPCNDEGRAMMELAFDVAPGANFAFHTAFGGMATFANGIEELAAAGSDIVVDDVLYFAEPMFQDGIIARAIDNVVNDPSNPVPYFSSAGNMARVSYEAAFVDSGEDLIVNNEARGDLHDFHGNGDWKQIFAVPDYTSHRIISIVLQWDQPFASLSTGGRGAQSDLDIYIINSSNNVLASSVDNNALVNGGSGEPIELLQFQVGGCDTLLQWSGYGCVTDPGTHSIWISLFDGPAPEKLKYVMFSHDISVDPATHSSTTFGHANAAGAMATGAAYWEATPWFCNNTDVYPEGHANAGQLITYNDCETFTDGTGNELNTAQLEYFSSAGGTPILFDPDGNRLTTPDMRLKPEVVGPDGANTTFFFSDSGRDEDALPNFFGTSASAPHVSGVAALMLEGNAGLTPLQIYDSLISTALNMNPRPEGPAEDADGFDFDTGWGFVQADAAVAAATGIATNAPPVVTISSPGDGTTVDEGDSVQFTGSATDTEDDNATLTAGLDWTSSLDGPIGTDTSSFSTTALTVGTHTITASVTDSGGRTGKDTITLTVNDPTNSPPEAKFEVVGGSCPFDFLLGGWVCEFDNKSTDDGGVPTASWEWDFGDGTFNTEDWDLTYPKAVLYDATGEYVVTLTVTDAGNLSHSASQTVYIGSSPPSNVHIGDLDGSATSAPRNRWDAKVTIEVHDGAHNPIGGAEINGNWSDGTAGICTTTQADGTCDITYADIKGNETSIGFTVDYITGTLDAYDATKNHDPDGDSDGTMITVLQSAGSNSPPMASFTNSCTGLACSFDGTGSSDSGGSIVSYAWDFGDGNTDSGSTVSHSYASGGTYTVTLTVTDNGGATDTASTSVTVSEPGTNNPPTASFTESCTDLACSFDGTGSSDSDGSITGYAWDFGNGATATGSAASHTYAAGGTYTVTLTVTDDDGATDTASSSVTVSEPATNNPPTASFTDNCTDLACSFDGTGSSDSDGSIASYAWNFGDGATATGSTASHTYAADGTYTVTLTVTDDDGATDTGSSSVTVSEPSDFTLSASGYKVQGRHTIDLNWNSTATDVTSGNVVIYSNGQLIETLPYANGGDGSYTHNTNNRGGGTYTYTVCDADDDSVCSNDATVTF